MHRLAGPIPWKSEFNGLARMTLTGAMTAGRTPTVIGSLNHRSPKGSILVVLQFLIVTVVIFLPILYGLFDSNEDIVIFCESVALLGLFAWSIWSWKTIAKSAFDPYSMFFVAAVVFHGGQAFLEIFHLNPDGILGGEFSAEILVKSLYLVILGVASLHLGALLGATRAMESARRTTPREKSLPNLRDIRYVGWALLFLSFIPSVYLLKDAISTVMTFGYFALYQREVSTGFGSTSLVLGSYLIPSALFLLAGSKGRSKEILVSVVVVFSFCFVQLFLGYRSYAAMSLIAYAWVWHRCVKPIPRAFLIAAACVVGFVVFPLIREIRQMSGAERSSVDFLVDAFFSLENPIVAIISEMGGTLVTVSHTLDLVPNSRGYDMGVGYMYSLLTPLPNLFWDLHPTIAYGTPTTWLIWAVDPVTARLGGSIGYSFLAEAYLNFGWIGVPITVGIIGFMIGRLGIWADRSGDNAKIAMVASFLAFFLHYVRGESAEAIRPLVWYALIPYCGVLALGSLTKLTAPKVNAR